MVSLTAGTGEQERTYTTARRRMGRLCRMAACWLAAFLPAAPVLAEDGHDLWLRYVPVQEARAADVRARATELVVASTSPTGQATQTEQAGNGNPSTQVEANGQPETGGEIIVTAQGRRQVLQDVPLAVSAGSAESLQNSGATDIRSLNQLAPSLLVSSTGTEANGSARIRGIGTVGDNPGLESSVAVFIDGVYRSRTGLGLNELGEIERVEVLRGPQGTLFGRNASAGLINIVSKKPNLNQMEGFAEGSYGNYNQWRLSGGITGPIGNSGFGYRLDGVVTQRDGFLKVINAANGTEKRVNDRDRYFVRGQLLYEPTDALSVRLIGDYSHRNEAAAAPSTCRRSRRRTRRRPCPATIPYRRPTISSTC